MLRTLWGDRSDGPHHLGRPGRQLIGPAHDALRGHSSRNRGERSGADELPARAGKEKLGGAQEKYVAHVAALVGTDEGPPSSLVSCLRLRLAAVRLRLAAVVARPHDGPPLRRSGQCLPSAARIRERTNTSPTIAPSAITMTGR